MECKRAATRDKLSGAGKTLIYIQHDLKSHPLKMKNRFVACDRKRHRELLTLPDGMMGTERVFWGEERFQAGGSRGWCRSLSSSGEQRRESRTKMLKQVSWEGPGLGISGGQEYPQQWRPRGTKQNKLPRCARGQLGSPPRVYRERAGPARTLLLRSRGGGVSRAPPRLGTGRAPPAAPAPPLLPR